MKAHVNGTRLEYEWSGRPDGEVVVLSHSLSASMGMWERQRAALEREWRVLRYDMRGHGASDAPGGAYTMGQLADDAEGLLEALGVSRGHFVGLSIGGMIGQTLAVRGCARLASLSLCNTTSGIPAAAGPVWDERIAAVRSAGMGAIADATIGRWFSQPFAHSAPAEVGRIRDQILATPPQGFIGCGEAIKAFDLTARIDGIRLPTLVIAGRDDPSTPLAASQVIQERVPGARLVVLPALHLSNIEQSAAFNDALTTFLREARM
jgi:3-oxoadipate enol-lactonase